MAGSRAAAAAAQRQLVRTAADTTFSVPARIATRSIATSVATASSRLGRGSRFTLSKDGPHARRTPRKSTPHGDPHNVPHEAAASTPVSAPSQTHQPAQPSTASTQAEPTQPGASAASAAVATDPSLHVPAVVPDAPQDVLQPSKPEFEGATRLLSQSALVVTREIEMMNIFLGFEQANKYSIHAPSGELVGYLAEEEQGFMTGAMKRQLLRTHRPFRATVMDASGKPVLMIRRPFTWINSTAHIYAVRSDYPIGYGAPQDADLELIGEVQQRWHLYRRKYELFLRRREAEAESFQQFANIDAMLLSWTFMMQDADSKLVGAIDRNFRGFGREIFTDTGQYVLRFDSVGETAMTEARLTPPSSGSQRDQDLAKGMELVKSHGTRALTLDERAVALATAVSIDFDYFSRHSEGAHVGGMFPWFYMGGMGGGGGNAEAPQGASSENVPAQQGGSADDGFGAGVAGGAVGGGMDYPYGPSDSGMSQDSRLDQPPPNASGYGEDAPTSAQQDSPWWNADQQGQAQDGDVWGTADSDPWAGANDTQQQDSNSWGSWGGGDSGDGGGGWGGFFGGDGGGSDW